jgi:poly-gamma-glutamate synthesis protein (capsule biosynthesis protein)
MAGAAGVFAEASYEAARDAASDVLADPRTPGGDAVTGETLLAMAPRTGGDREWPGGQEPVPARPVRVLFTGDIMTHAKQLKLAAVPGGYDFVKQFARIRPYFQDGLTVGNLETTFSGAEKTFAGYPAFNTPDELATALYGLGVRVVSLANNHILDRGYHGIQRTIEVLDRAGILWTGVSDKDIAPGQALMVDYGGLRWAFVNFTYGTNLPGTGRNSRGLGVNVITQDGVRASLRAARELRPDVTVALFHWGNEYEHSPTDTQVRLAELSAEEGADLVIGTHPHVLQPIDVISTSRGHTVVAYSLGNFIANQIKVPRERSAVLAVELERAPEGGVRILRASVAPVFVSSACTEVSGCVIQALYGGTSPAADAQAPAAVGPPASAPPAGDYAGTGGIAGSGLPGVSLVQGVTGNPAGSEATGAPGTSGSSGLLETRTPPEPNSAPAKLLPESTGTFMVAAPGLDQAVHAAQATVSAAVAEARADRALAPVESTYQPLADGRPPVTHVGRPHVSANGRSHDLADAMPQILADARPPVPVSVSTEVPPGPEWSVLPEVPDSEAAKALEAGKRILDFLGAGGKPDAYGFYTVWEASRPSIMPVRRRSAP